MKKTVSKLVGLGSVVILAGTISPAHAQTACPTNWRTTNQRLTTDRLRYAAPILGIGEGKTGIQFSRAVGRSFQEYVTDTFSGWSENTTPVDSTLRREFTNGYRTKVIPDMMGYLVAQGPYGTVAYEKSSFFEMKAVKGKIYLSSSQYQIYGLIDVADNSPASADRWTVPIYFITTGNTAIYEDVALQASQRNVAIFQSIVCEDPDALRASWWLQRSETFPINAQAYNVGGFNADGLRTIHPPKRSPVYPSGDPDPAEVN